MTIRIVFVAPVVLALALACSGRTARAEETPQKVKITVLTGRGNEAGRIIEKDGTVKELTRDQLTFKNTAIPRPIEANPPSAQKPADDAKGVDKAKKPIEKKADAPKKPTAAADVSDDKKKADEEKKKAEDAEKKKAKAIKAYNDKSYDYSGAPYIPESKKKSLSDISLESNKPAKTAETSGGSAPATDSGTK